MTGTGSTGVRIALDARMRFHSGIGTYLRGMFPELVQRLPECVWHVIQPADGQWELPGATLLSCDVPPLTLAEHWRLPRLLHEHRIDWLVVPHINLPRFWPAARTIAVLHDLIPLDYPRHFRRHVPPAFRYLATRALREAAVVVADTRAVAARELPLRRERRRCCELAPVVPRYSPAGAVYPGVSPLPADGAPPVAGRYIFCVGGKPYKHADLAVQLFETLNDPECRLVLRQAPHEDGGRTARAVAASPVRERITVCPRLTPAALGAAYRQARVFLFCSEAEGFGYPPLEAMQAGVPVLLRRGSPALAETAGNAAVWFDAERIPAAAGQLRALLDDETLRQEMIARGGAHVRQFTWAAAGMQLAEVVRRVLAGRTATIPTLLREPGRTLTSLPAAAPVPSPRTMAIAHDWVFHRRGGEVCWEEIRALYPEARLLALFAQERNWPAKWRGVRITASGLNRLPGVARYYRQLLPLFPSALRRMASDADLTISISHCAIKNLPITGRHLCYYLSPARYFYDLRDEYMRSLPVPLRPLANRMLDRLAA